MALVGYNAARSSLPQKDNTGAVKSASTSATLYASVTIGNPSGVFRGGQGQAGTVWDQLVADAGASGTITFALNGSSFLAPNDFRSKIEIAPGNPVTRAVALPSGDRTTIYPSGAMSQQGTFPGAGPYSTGVEYLAVDASGLDRAATPNRSRVGDYQVRVGNTRSSLEISRPTQ